MFSGQLFKKKNKIRLEDQNSQESNKQSKERFILRRNQMAARLYERQSLDNAVHTTNYFLDYEDLEKDQVNDYDYPPKLSNQKLMNSSIQDAFHISIQSNNSKFQNSQASKKSQSSTENRPKIDHKRIISKIFGQASNSQGGNRTLSDLTRKHQSNSNNRNLNQYILKDQYQKPQATVINFNRACHNRTQSQMSQRSNTSDLREFKGSYFKTKTMKKPIVQKAKFTLNKIKLDRLRPYNTFAQNLLPALNSKTHSSIEFQSKSRTNQYSDLTKQPMITDTLYSQTQQNSKYATEMNSATRQVKGLTQNHDETSYSSNESKPPNIKFDVDFNFIPQKQAPLSPKKKWERRMKIKSRLICNEFRTSPKRDFKILNQVDSKNIANIIRNEQPNTNQLKISKKAKERVQNNLVSITGKCYFSKNQKQYDLAKRQENLDFLEREDIGSNDLDQKLMKILKPASPKNKAFQTVQHKNAEARKKRESKKVISRVNSKSNDSTLDCCKKDTINTNTIDTSGTIQKYGNPSSMAINAAPPNVRFLMNPKLSSSVTVNNSVHIVSNHPSKQNVLEKHKESKAPTFFNSKEDISKKSPGKAQNKRYENDSSSLDSLEVEHTTKNDNKTIKHQYDEPNVYTQRKSALIQLKSEQQRIQKAHMDGTISTKRQSKNSFKIGETMIGKFNKKGSVLVPALDFQKKDIEKSQITTIVTSSWSSEDRNL